MACEKQPSRQRSHPTDAVTCEQLVAHKAHIRMPHVLIEHQAVYQAGLIGASEHKHPRSGFTFTGLHAQAFAEAAQVMNASAVHSGSFILPYKFKINRIIWLNPTELTQKKTISYTFENNKTQVCTVTE